MQIIFPKFSTIAYADKIIQNCVDAQKSTEQLTFDFKSTTWMDPFVITVISGVIQYCLQTRKVIYIPPKDIKFKDYLSQIGFNTFFNLNGNDIHKDTSVELRQLTVLTPHYIDDIIVLIDSKMKISTGIKDSLKMSMTEIINNVFEHIKEFLKVNEGTFTIISGNGKVNFYSNKIENYNMSAGFKGTIVNLEINANKESFYFLTSEEKYLF